MKKFFIVLFMCFNVSGFAQDTLSLTLFEVIRLAKDSSLAAFRQKNMYLADYWTFRNYKADLFLLQWVSVCDMCKAVDLSLLKKSNQTFLKVKSEISPTSNLFKIFFQCGPF